MAKHMTVKECEQHYPDVFKDEAGFPDKRLTDKLKRYMVHMICEGENPYDAKLKTLCIAHPPDHFEQVPAGGEFPKMLYNANGKFALVQDEEQMENLMKEKGWSAKPGKAHLDKLQKSSIPRDENIKRLEKELAAEVKAKSEESVGTAAA
jgi:hypothetical protein